MSLNFRGNTKIFGFQVSTLKFRVGKIWLDYWYSVILPREDNRKNIFVHSIIESLNLEILCCFACWAYALIWLSGLNRFWLWSYFIDSAVFTWFLFFPLTREMHIVHWSRSPTTIDKREERIKLSLCLWNSVREKTVWSKDVEY